MQGWRHWTRSFLELFALCGVAITQPILDVFGRAPEVFTFRGARTPDIVWFAILIAIVPAAVCVAVEFAVGLASARAARVVHLLLCSALVALFALQAVRRSDLADGVAMAALAAGAVGVGALLYRWRHARQWLALMAVGPTAFVGGFLFSSPVSDLLAQGDVAAAQIDEIADARSVVLIVWDEFPVTAIVNGDGAIDAELYPNLSVLAGDGAWFRNATTVATVTTVAVPSILTGNYPKNGLAAVASDHPQNLFTLLAGRYDIEAEEQATALCPASLCSGALVDSPTAKSSTIAPDEHALRDLLRDARSAYGEMVSLDDATRLRAFEEPTTPRPATDADEAIAVARDDPAKSGGPPVYEVDAFARLLASIERYEDPTLHFLHLQLPHGPYRFLPNGQTYEWPWPDERLDAVDHRGPSRYESDAAKQRLILQAGYVDTLVGQLIDRLRETGLYDDTVVVLTSDHGIGLVPGGEKRPLADTGPIAEALYADLLYVPLIIKAPGLPPGTVSDVNAMTVDIVPTIADLLGAEIPWSVDGFSLARDRARTSPTKRFNKVLPGDLNGGLIAGFGGPATIAPTVTFDGAVFFEQVLRRNVDELFRGDNPDHRRFDVADAGELVGAEVDALAVGAASGLTVRSEDLEGLRDDSAPASLVPIHVVGQIAGARDEEAVTVAIVVDGVVAAVVPTYADAETSHRVDALLDFTLVSHGRHEVEVFTIEGREGARVLHAVAVD